MLVVVAVAIKLEILAAQVVWAVAETELISPLELVLAQQIEVAAAAAVAGNPEAPVLSSSAMQVANEVQVEP